MHPLNEVAFSFFSGFALPGIPATSEKNTVFGNALSLADSGHFYFQGGPHFCTFLLGGGGLVSEGEEQEDGAQAAEERRRRRRRRRRRK